MNSIRCHWISTGVFTLALAFSNLAAGAVEPFFAPKQEKGGISVKLYPTENVKSGSPVLITFGMPFPRGSLTARELSTVRVLDSRGVEIPAYIDQLTPWRSIGGSGTEASPVRVARIQFMHTFTTVFPGCETVAIEWGMSRRAKHRPDLAPPRTAWHLADRGSFSAADSVHEPDVYAVLPKEYLCQGMIRPARMLPLAESVPENREDPAALRQLAAASGYAVQDHAQHNFFFSIIDDDPQVDAENRCPYKTQSEPWLYDRSSTMYMLYLRSGHVRALREAVRNAQFYKNKLWSADTTPARFAGLFRLKTPVTEGYPTGNGAMYSYNECLAYTWWLTCDDKMLEPIERVVRAHEENDEPTRWDPSLDFWTERHTALRLLANTIAYEVTGNSIYRDTLVRQYRDFIWHQNGAGGVLPKERVDGALWHYGGQHGDGGEKTLVASSWMTVLTVDAMVRVYALTGDKGIADFVRRVGAFEQAACRLDNEHAYGVGPLWYCDYMVRYDGSSDVRTGHTIEHSLEIASTVAWAAYFSGVLGKDPRPLLDLAGRMYAAYCAGVRYWIRPDGLNENAFRVSPWRKYGWEHRPSGSFSWIMTTLK
ncbi:MAG: hypothetical protein ACYC9O_14075 [Candidatus Latescibacterota bacterium]